MGRLKGDQATVQKLEAIEAFLLTAGFRGTAGGEGGEVGEKPA